MQPVRASQQSSATFADKEQIWADNAASSSFFGNVYVCWENFVGGGAGPLVVARSSDGGTTWVQEKVTAAHAVAAKHWGQSGCTVRTDSRGVVYVFYEEFQNPEKVELPPTGTHFLVKSFDGGATWTKPMALYSVVDPSLLNFDGTSNRCVKDGLGARNDLSASPSVSIANGAPTGDRGDERDRHRGADGRDGLNDEHVLFAYSNDGGNAGTWSAPQQRSRLWQRSRILRGASDFAHGRRRLVVYNAFTTPFRTDTTTPRGLLGVVMPRRSRAGRSGRSARCTAAFPVTRAHRARTTS